MTPDELRYLLRLIRDLRDEIHHPGAWLADDRPDPAELDDAVDDAIAMLGAAIGDPDRK